MTRTPTLLALAAVLALAGCASATPGTGSTGTQAGSHPSSSPSATVSGHAQATREASRILAAFRPPTGAQRLAGRPSGASLLKNVTDSPGTPNLVDDVAWWSVSGGPQAVTDAISTPAGAHREGSASSGGPTGSTYTAFFSWPSGAVLDTRQLQVETARDGARTILRVDAVVTWLPPRPANTLIPATVGAVTVTYTPGMFPPNSKSAKPVGPITSSDPAVVQAVADAINTQPVRQPGAYHCPMSDGTAITVVFADQAGGAPVATAHLDMSGCSAVQVSVVGGGSTTLTDGYALGNKIAALVHLRLPAPLVNGGAPTPVK